MCNIKLFNLQLKFPKENVERHRERRWKRWKSFLDFKICALHLCVKFITMFSVVLRLHSFDEICKQKEWTRMCTRSFFSLIFMHILKISFHSKIPRIRTDTEIHLFGFHSRPISMANIISLSLFHFHIWTAVEQSSREEKNIALKVAAESGATEMRTKSTASHTFCLGLRCLC